ncbi:aldehyde dehydrogenase (NADP(+)) [Thalassospira sp. MCCC 1A01428]|uniref:aldehyde dehydrogenase (NADP(+)) n=1 Tax=Thalassospira sp. MCCC 1A01428 TaxID=1470575 RepID=UPI000A1FA078|nr:aldehyde dehydrogenase (NADP(+)) [Thalassospira sp. MCCC 1A01428]OSQ43985.1 2,5-dioxovalerate dehydrogenase [Thalassospira sp. MCCC 1A01428]
MLSGKNYIAGEWLDGPDVFQADNPATGEKLPTKFQQGTEQHVDQAARAANECAEEFASMSPSKRAGFLRACADEIDARGDELTEMGNLESALPPARLQGERGRTVGQLRFFADWIEEGSWFEARIETAQPDRAPLPKPDIRSMFKALGPVGVFGASNFPLAFSVAGGDTASALAAGCPVVFKAHAAHPGTSEIVAQAIDAAIKKTGMPKGVFSMVHGGGRVVGQSLVAHPMIKAVGFTGSTGGGRALFDIAVSRPEPIPFYGELGSNNPVYLMPNAMKKNAAGIAKAWAGSLTMGVGQFCTNPGLLLALKGDDIDTFVTTAVEELGGVASQAMLTDRVSSAYHDVNDAMAKHPKVTCALKRRDGDGPFEGSPAVYRVSAADWEANPELAEEMFGPAGIIIECDSTDQILAISAKLHGQLTATIQMDDADAEFAGKLRPLLEKCAGRILVNGWPTGVEVCHSMVHGGPYPASTDSRATSVGSLAIKRFVRPVAYQAFADALLPDALKDGNPLNIPRLVDGKWQMPK